MVTLTQSTIVEQLSSLLSPAHLITDTEELQRSSIDRFRRYEGFHGVFRMPLPAAVVMAESTD